MHGIGSLSLPSSFLPPGFSSQIFTSLELDEIEIESLLESFVDVLEDTLDELLISFDDEEVLIIDELSSLVELITVSLDELVVIFEVVILSLIIDVDNEISLSFNEELVPLLIWQPANKNINNKFLIFIF